MRILVFWVLWGGSACVWADSRGCEREFGALCRDSDEGFHLRCSDGVLRSYNARVKLDTT